MLGRSEKTQQDSKDTGYSENDTECNEKEKKQLLSSSISSYLGSGF